MELDFEIDKLTESIELATTGERFETLVLPILTVAELKDITEKNGWRFDWAKELKQRERQVYKLVTEKEPSVFQGLISLEIDNGFIYMHLIENAPFNIGKNKKYNGVCGNLTAYGCKISMECGFGGVVSFTPKTALVEHYIRTLVAEHIGRNKLAIFEQSADILIKKYFS